ncbi:MAG: ATP-binding protein [Elusimicrobiota bacterium]
METDFAPAERLDGAVVRKQHEQLSGVPMLRQFMDAVPTLVVVMNRRRQIVFYNRAVAETFGSEQAIGLRPGELMGCVHSDETPGGCGTTRFCGVCGAVRATLEAIEGNRSVEECRIVTQDPAKVYELRVWATPFEHQGERYVVFSLLDISHEKRRAKLERIFFHDVLNTAGGVRGLAEIVAEASPEEAETCRKMLLIAADRLIEEIESQRDLTAAERGELVPKPVRIASKEFLEDLAGLYRSHEIARGKSIGLDPGSEDVQFSTDRTLLSRVLGNMLKNALEASPAVKAGCRKDGDGLVFWVNNPAVMSEESKLQVFMRSYSTKGADRGLGTYSMKLITERYLKGRVTFESTAEKGTTFFARIPA